MRIGRFSWVFQVTAFLFAAIPAAAGQTPANSKLLNPDIAVIGNFVGNTGTNKVNPGPVMEMQESEVSFRADIDPYARADFYIAFSESGVDLEEGYITFPALHGGFQLKVGKMRAAFGKVNALHTHLVPWIDRPLMTENLVGGEEGISDAGFSFSPKALQAGRVSLDTTLQVFRGTSAALFNTTLRRDLTYVGRLHGFADMSESTNLDFGFSVAHGPDDIADFAIAPPAGRYNATLYGVDAALKWRPLSRSIYRGFSLRSEAVLGHRDVGGGPIEATGFYASSEYQFARRWSAGFRYDNAQQRSDPSLRDTGESALVTYRPSEFSQVRVQYRRTDYAVLPAEPANEVLFQFQFAIGAHGAHPFY